MERTFGIILDDIINIHAWKSPFGGDLLICHDVSKKEVLTFRCLELLNTRHLKDQPTFVDIYGRHVNIDKR